MTQVQAIHTVHYNPTGRLVATGAFDDDGNAILRADPDIHEPGDRFVIEKQTDLADLYEAGAIAILEAHPLTHIDSVEAPPLEPLDPVEALWGVSAAERRANTLTNAQLPVWTTDPIHTVDLLS